MLTILLTVLLSFTPPWEPPPPPVECVTECTLIDGVLYCPPPSPCEITPL